MRRLPSVRNREREFYERQAGFFVAMPMVGILLLTLALIKVENKEQEEEPLEMKVLLEMAEPEPEPEENLVPEPEPEIIEVEDLVPEPPQPEEVAATRKDSTEEGEEIVDPVQSEELVPEDIPVLVDPNQPKVPETMSDWIPNADEAAEIQSLRKELESVQQNLDMKAIELREKIIREEVLSAAKDFELNSDGGLQGAIRTLDLEGFPDHIVTDVLTRYGIKQERRRTKAQGGRNYLNAAKTDDGIYENTAREGYYEVMVLSNYSFRMMAMMEVEALQRRGYNPSKSRIRSISFGIVLNADGEYDLGVVNIEVEQVF